MDKTFKRDLSELQTIVADTDAFFAAHRIDASIRTHVDLSIEELFVNMVKAGELGGVLEIVLARLAQFMEKAQRIKGKVKAALFYPAAVMFVAGAVVAILMVFVVPRFKEIFNDLLEGASLPAFTQFVLGASEFIAHNILYSILGVVALIVALKLALRGITNSDTRLR